jgi:hypothetical protein
MFFEHPDPARILVCRPRPVAGSISGQAGAGPEEAVEQAGEAFERGFQAGGRLGSGRHCVPSGLNIPPERATWVKIKNRIAPG